MWAQWKFSNFSSNITGDKMLTKRYYRKPYIFYPIPRHCIFYTALYSLFIIPLIRIIPLYEIDFFKYRVVPCISLSGRIDCIMDPVLWTIAYHNVKCFLTQYVGSKNDTFSIVLILWSNFLFFSNSVQSNQLSCLHLILLTFREKCILSSIIVLLQNEYFHCKASFYDVFYNIVKLITTRVHMGSKM